jgi:hypothetical protein
MTASAYSCALVSIGLGAVDFFFTFILATLFASASLANRSARKRTVFSWAARFWAWYSAQACAPSRARSRFFSSDFDITFLISFLRVQLDALVPNVRRTLKTPVFV